MSISSSFVLAGQATFTIQTPTQHHSYRVDRVEASGRWAEAFFVKLLTGPDNQSDWTYIGKLDDFTGQLVLTAKSKLGADAFPVKLFNRVMARVWSNDHQAYEQHGFKTHHMGRCGRCGHDLTNPVSIESGIGPECAKKLGVDRQPEPAVEYDPLGGPMDGAPVDQYRSIRRDGKERKEVWEWMGRMLMKDAFARVEACQEQLAFMSDPDFNNAYDR